MAHWIGPLMDSSRWCPAFVAGGAPRVPSGLSFLDQSKVPAAISRADGKVIRSLDILVMTNAPLPIPAERLITAADLAPSPADFMMAAGGVSFEKCWRLEDTVERSKSPEVDDREQRPPPVILPGLGQAHIVIRIELRKGIGRACRGAGGAKEFADQPVAIDRVHRKAVQIDNAVDRDCNHEGDPTYA
jgi:hypothetical protein